MPACKGCGQLIKWVEMSSGKKMPLDFKPMQMIQVKEGIGAVVEAYTPHWASCSRVNDFKPKKEE